MERGLGETFFLCHVGHDFQRDARAGSSEASGLLTSILANLSL
jgi:hypothetical protein